SRLHSCPTLRSSDLRLLALSTLGVVLILLVIRLMRMRRDSAIPPASKKSKKPTIRLLQAATLVSLKKNTMGNPSKKKSAALKLNFSSNSKHQNASHPTCAHNLGGSHEFLE